MPTDKRDLQLMAYREIAIAALASVAPLGNAGRMKDHFLPRARDVRRRIEYGITPPPAPDGSDLLKIFSDTLPTFVREALDLVGYDEDTIVDILADFS